MQTVVEPALVYPLLRGRDVHRWQAVPSTHFILTQDPETRKGIPENEMKRRYPKTYAYLKQFEGNPQSPARGTLRARSGYRQYFRSSDPFYSIYNVGHHTLAPFRVVWRGQVAPSLNVSVSSLGENNRPILNDQTAYSVPFESEAEAHYVAALLNSSPVRTLYSCLAYKHTSMKFIQGIALRITAQGQQT